VAGEAELQGKLERAIKTTLCEKRDQAKTLKDVRDMRNLMLAEHAKLGLWDIKRTKGGLVEIEFIAQYLQLIANNSEMLDTNTLKALGKITLSGAFSMQVASELVDACQLYQRLTQVLRLCVADQYKPEESAKSLNEAVARAAGMPDIAATEALLAETQSRVASIFNDIIGR
jgi:[glutamine synthetase] adenylyltransferase / [glutamine synthetase]-adenylyl-L-tyrosine phosphorylase